MTRAGFPFPALVGLDTLKLALQLAALDHRLSVLIRGDKGAGKSTAARALAGLLDASAPFVTLPIGATEDRLLGGLDVQKALRGEPALKPGLLAEAHDGVLYVDEVNLLPDHLADALLDAVASGVHIVEREGFSVSQSAEFAMIGSMNPEEGSLRPQLLDRFALVVDVVAPLEPDARADVLERRLDYDADPERFRETHRDAELQLAQHLAAAKQRMTAIVHSRALLHHVATRVAEYGVRSLRADLAVVRASRALAALNGAAAVEPEHVEAVLPLALAHRASDPPRSTRPPSNPPTDNNSRDENDKPLRQDSAERVFSAAEVVAPRIVVEQPAMRAGMSSYSAPGVERGPAVAVRRTAEPRELDVRSTLVHAVARSGSVVPGIDDLHEKIRVPQGGTRYVFIVDSSGSHAVQDRIRFVKGAVTGLLDASQERHDEVVMIACRGATASVIVEPTSARADLDRSLAYLPTGGRTPLAHSLELAAGYVTDHAMLVLLTDGHANVPTRTSDAWGDAQTAARALRCPALIIDTEDDRSPTGRPRQLATVMGATYQHLRDLDATSVIRVIRELS